MQKDDLWNLPNAITIGRLLLIVPVLVLLQVPGTIASLSCLCLFLLAALLDAVDGWVARKTDSVTFFGKFMDPLADKIMVVSVLVYFVADGRLPALVLAILLAREFYVSGVRMLALGERIEIAADRGGKLKTATQMAGIVCLLAAAAFTEASWFDLERLGRVLVYVSTVLAVSSAIGYTRAFARERAERRRGSH